MIRVDGLSYSYPRSDTPVFDDVGFSVARSHVFSILGPNGRGKTTLLKCLAGLIRPTSGTIQMGGDIGYVPQQFATPFSYTVREVVVMGRARHVGLFGAPRRHDRDLADQALAELGITDFADRLITSLSGGERQMVLIARALASGAAIMVLDEPTSALDFRNQAIVLAALRRLADSHGLTIVMTTHHPQHALEISDQALLMHGADRPAVGPAGDVLTEDDLSALYGIPVQAAAVTQAGRRSTTMVPLLSGMSKEVQEAAE
jgi:iron complex transport system ATP-binding protein